MTFIDLTIPSFSQQFLLFKGQNVKELYMSAIASERSIICFTNNEVEIPEPLGLTLRARDNVLWDVLTKKDGHKPISWNKADPIQIDAARLLFRQMQGEGMEAFQVDSEGHAKGKKMTEFSEDAEHVIFKAKEPLKGG
jgi:hypothetical protein